MIIVDFLDGLIRKRFNMILIMYFLWLVGIILACCSALFFENNNELFFTIVKKYNELLCVVSFLLVPISFFVKKEKKFIYRFFLCIFTMILFLIYLVSWVYFSGGV